jgi:N-methylhydantoinase A
VTVTDAHVWLGRIPVDAFLGGQARLDRDGIEAPLRSLAAALGASMEEAAAGVLEVANTLMEGALRWISVERGYDARSLALVAFGGAAPLHACDLAARLGVRRILVPPDPGLLSARGILIADIRKDVSRTILVPHGELQGRALERVFRPLEDAARADLRAEGVPTAEVRVERWLDARYAGQSYELQVPATARWVEAFHRAHRARYGFERPQTVVEAVTARVTARAPVGRPRPTPWPRGARPTPMRHRAYQSGRWTSVSRWDRASLPAGHALRGPAVITEYSATTWVPPGFRARVLPYGDLELTPGRS